MVMRQSLLGLCTSQNISLTRVLLHFKNGSKIFYSIDVLSLIYPLSYCPNLNWSFWLIPIFMIIVNAVMIILTYTFWCSCVFLFVCLFQVKMSLQSKQHNLIASQTIFKSIFKLAKKLVILILYWSIIALQCSVSFCCRMK